MREDFFFILFQLCVSVGYFFSLVVSGLFSSGLFGSGLLAFLTVEQQCVSRSSRVVYLCERKKNSKPVCVWVAWKSESCGYFFSWFDRIMQMSPLGYSSVTKFIFSLGLLLLSVNPNSKRPNVKSWNVLWVKKKTESSWCWLFFWFWTGRFWVGCYWNCGYWNFWYILWIRTPFYRPFQLDRLLNCTVIFFDNSRISVSLFLFAAGQIYI